MNINRLHSPAWVLVFVALLGGCSDKADVSSLLAATVVYFEEAEPGIDPYPVRMIATEHLLRIDNGNDADDFLVFNRVEQRISSLNRTDNTVFVIEPKPVELPVQERLKIEVGENDISKMPAFQGVKPTHKTISAGGKQCRDTVSVNGILPEVVAVSREYLSVLAWQQYYLLENTPEALRDPCMLTNLIHWPDEHLKDGFPIRESDYRGFVRELTGFESMKVRPEIFEIPEGVKEIRINTG